MVGAVRLTIRQVGTWQTVPDLTVTVTLSLTVTLPYLPRQNIVLVCYMRA